MLKSLRLYGLIAMVILSVGMSCGLMATGPSDEDVVTVGRDSVASYSKKKDVNSLPVVHPRIGEQTCFGDNKSIRFVGRLHNKYDISGPTRDGDIYSPKSINIHPSGEKFYVNSLEGSKTVVYTLPELKKTAVINHRFTSSDSALWAAPSGLFKFRHYKDNLNTFTGKPVESIFSHDGRYLWVPYYRRSYDLNAQDPSAIAIIDTKSDKIVKMMEAGVLPKMIAVSPDSKTVAVTHWGDNTVGLIDVSSADPAQWRYRSNVVIGHQLIHNFSLTIPVDRDTNTGEALRGTAFSPDGRFLFVGCMSGGGIAIIDLKEDRYIGKLTGMMPNVRHIVIKDGGLYASINLAGYVQRISMAKVMDAAVRMSGNKGNVLLTGWESAKVASGARTLEVSPKGDFIFVACNAGSVICILDSTMRNVGSIAADSYPVGLDISADGKWLITTSQGRKGDGGNCVDIFELTGIEGLKEYDEVSEMSGQDRPERVETENGDTDRVSKLQLWVALREKIDELWESGVLVNIV
ncbi:MAG: hypothetical protein K2J15_07155, partial [Muribaculaceae bacterium]|nr:hypothetical protein [Muribaculaceae bacterium]